MTIQVTIDLPEEIYQRAERFARLINCDLSSVLADNGWFVTATAQR